MSRRTFVGAEVRCSRPFLLGAGLSLGLLEGTWLAPVLLAALLHELGHLLAIRALGGRVRRLCFRLSGMDIVYDARHMTYGGEALAALAGPGCNLIFFALFGLLSRGKGGFFARFAGCHGVLGLFHLLPALPLDGGRALRALMEGHWPGRGEGLCQGLSLALGAILLAAGLALLAKRGNPTLFAAGFVIFRAGAGKIPLHRGKKAVQ